MAEWRAYCTASGDVLRIPEGLRGNHYVPRPIMQALIDALFIQNRGRRSSFCLKMRRLVGLRAVVVVAALLGSASAIEAQTSITLAWDANTEPDVAGYAVSYGNQSGVYPTLVDVGNATSMPFTPSAGVVYYFAVRAYNSANPRMYSPFSAEVSYGLPGNRPPTLVRPANQTSVEKASVSLQVVGSDPEGSTLTYSATGLPPALTVNPATGLISGTLAAGSAGTYSVTASVSDGALTDSKTFTWTVTKPLLRVKQASLQFKATKKAESAILTGVTPAKLVRVLAVKNLAWSATSDQPWLRVTNGAGNGNGWFRVKIVNPDNVIGGSTFLTATITVTSQTPDVAAVTIPVTLTITQKQPAAAGPVGQSTCRRKATPSRAR